MVSTIRYYSFKDLPWTRKQPDILIIFLITLGAVIWAFSEVVLVLLAGTYAVIGVTLHLVRFIRHRLMVSRAARFMPSLERDPPLLLIAGASSLLGSELKLLLGA